MVSWPDTHEACHRNFRVIELKKQGEIPKSGKKKAAPFPKLLTVLTPGEWWTREILFCGCAVLSLAPQSRGNGFFSLVRKQVGARRSWLFLPDFLWQKKEYS